MSWAAEAMKGRAGNAGYEEMRCFELFEYILIIRIVLEYSYVQKEDDSNNERRAPVTVTD